MQEDSTFAQNIIHVLATRLHHTVNVIADLSFRPVNGRLANLLLQESKGEGWFRPSWFTQYELAARLGTVTDVIQRTLRKMEAQGLIEVDRDQIRILHREGLENLAE